MIREANIFDIPKVIELGKELHKKAVTHHAIYDFNSDQAILACKDFILSEDKLLAVKIIDNDLVGFFWAALTTPLAGNNIIATDYMLFVIKKYQGKNIAARFIKYYEKWAKNKGANIIELSVSSGVKQEKVLSMYSYFGYKPQSVTYYKEI